MWISRSTKVPESWQDLKKLIILRNELTHPKIKLDLQPEMASRPTKGTSIGDVLLACEVMVWYFNIVSKGLNSITSGTVYTWDKVPRLYLWLSVCVAVDLAGRNRDYLEKKLGLPEGIDITHVDE